MDGADGGFGGELELEGFEFEGAEFDGDGFGLDAFGPFLLEGSPGLVGGEGGAEVFWGDFGIEGDEALWAVVLVSGDGDEDTVTGHGAGVMVAAFDFVVRISFGGVVAVVDGAGDGEALFDHAFGDHVGGDLIFESAHALVEIAELPVFFPVVTFFAFGPGAHYQAALAGECVRSSFFVGFFEGADVGCEIVFPKGLECGFGVFFAKDSAEPELKGPALSEDLVDVAAGAGADGVEVIGVFELDEIFAVEEFEDVLAALVGDFLAAVSEIGIVHFQGHGAGGVERGDVERGEESDFSVPGGVEGVVLGAFDDAVVVGVFVDEEEGGFFDLGPVGFEE